MIGNNYAFSALKEEMRSAMKAKVLGILLLLLPCLTQGQVPTLGRDFWVTFPENGAASGSAVQTLYIAVSAVDTCSGSATIPNTTWRQTFWLAAGQTALIVVPDSIGHVRGSEVVVDKGIHVQTTGTASVSLLNMCTGSMDACNVLSTPALRDQYVVQTYPSGVGDSTVMSCSQFAVVATQNGTTVDIVPSSPTHGGIAAGATITVNLGRGGVYQVQSVAGGDLSGSTVRARDCMPIAVFQGNSSALIPDSCSTGDMLVDQAVPTAYWGRHFVVTSTVGRTSDRCRVTSLYDSCHVSLGDSVLTTIDALQTYEFELHGSQEAVYLETSQPAYVCIYLTSNCEGGNGGDPAMVVVNPVEQRVRELAFYAYVSSWVPNLYVNIVAQRDGCSTMRIDTLVLGPLFHPVPGNSEYVYARVPIGSGAHVIHGGSRGFTAHIYGMGNGNVGNSFAYSAGAMMRKESNQLFVDSVWTGLLPDTLHFCQGDCAELSVKLAGSVADVYWTFEDSVATEQGVAVSHCFDSVGFYDVEVRVTNDSSGCFGDEDGDLIKLPVRVTPSYFYSASDTIHVSRLPWRFGGKMYYGAVENDTLRKLTKAKCDSIIVYSLFVYDDTVYIDLYDSVCAGQPYARNGFQLTGEETAYSDDDVRLFVRVDSITVYRLHLTLLLPTVSSIDVVPNEGDGYFLMAHQNSDFYYWSSQPFDPGLVSQQNLQSVNISPRDTTTYILLSGYRTMDDTLYLACRSSDSVTLAPRRSSAIWIPNIFVPGDGDNGLFKVIAESLYSFEIRIYNRFGQMVFHTRDINEGWDGKWNTTPCPQGAYTYYIRYSDSVTPTSTNSLLGTVTLLR